MTALHAAAVLGAVLTIAGILWQQYAKRDRTAALADVDESTRWFEVKARIVKPVIVTPAKFDTDTARAELVSDDLLIVAALGQLPEQRKAGEWS